MYEKTKETDFPVFLLYFFNCTQEKDTFIYFLLACNVEV